MHRQIQLEAQGVRVIPEYSIFWISFGFSSSASAAGFVSIDAGGVESCCSGSGTGFGSGFAAVGGPGCWDSGVLNEAAGLVSSPALAKFLAYNIVLGLVKIHMVVV